MDCDSLLGYRGHRRTDMAVDEVGTMNEFDRIVWTSLAGVIAVVAIIGVGLWLWLETL